MIHLPLPADAGDEIIERQCRRDGWKSYRNKWLAAVAAYRSAGGDPWAITPAAFSERQQSRLRALYDTRRNSGGIKRIRTPEERHRSCPLCGSYDGPSIDHALPRTTFPEFSIVRENLVPSCTTCNSTEKGEIYRGTTPPERLIHPYYDAWVAGPIWQVDLGVDLDAIVLTAVPLRSVPTEREATVRFHLATVLGDRWRESSRRLWADLPLLIYKRSGPEATEHEVVTELEVLLDLAERTEGVNAWRPALLRGVLADSRTPRHLATAVSALRDTMGEQ